MSADGVPSIPPATAEESSHTLGACAKCQRAAAVAARWDEVRAAREERR